MLKGNDRLAGGALGRCEILGTILAGGRSRRFGIDKAEADLAGVPLLQRVIARIEPQVKILTVSGEPRPGIDLPAIADRVRGEGPLAGLCSVIAWAEDRGFSLVATFSCDTPFVPFDTVSRLRSALTQTSGCAVARHGGISHPACALWRVSARARIEGAFQKGVRSLHAVVAGLDAAYVEFAGSAEAPGGDPFFNINSQADMRLAQAWLGRDRVPAER